LDALVVDGDGGFASGLADHRNGVSSEVECLAAKERNDVVGGGGVGKNGWEGGRVRRRRFRKRKREGEEERIRRRGRTCCSSKS